MRFPILAGLLASSVAAAAPAYAQNSWTGFHVGGRVGLLDVSRGNEQIEFDTNLDGSFGDTVRTAAGANAFSPGFCTGAAVDRVPTAGCRRDKTKTDYAASIGYDQQLGSVVVGIVGEYGSSSARDSVSAFSTTPAFYTMTRRLKANGAIRARAGLAIGDTLPYVTAGIAQGRIRHSFATSNTANTFVQRGDDRNVTGFRYGAGLEQRFGNFAIGALYLGTRYDDSDYRVRSQGPAPATNPFILVNPNGTDFRRSDDKFTVHSFNLTLSYRL
ncbi:outer membrane beta-barrel protein [Sphingomonas rosea]|uniref:Outer membrane beta-barrel protein n=1 Tax=Sphingomonas rosea TaxID=335605 RepID=A0ABP7TK27_9SPHN